MILRVFLPHPPQESEAALLRQQLDPGVNLLLGPEQPEPAAYQVLVAGRPTREQLAASADLHTLIIPWAGIPAETRELMRGFPQIRVHNLHHNAAPVAELTLALLLAAAKFIVPLDRALRQHDWRPRYQPNPSVLLDGKTALILGYGAIGRRVARACRALGMEVLATRRSIPGATVDEIGVVIYPGDRLDELLPRAHVLIITLPLTEETEGLIDGAALGRLPPGAVLVNVGRGSIVDQEALFVALQSGHLAGAGLDVWYNYPEDEAARANTPPAGFPFHTLDNVVLSPHRGGAVRETGALRMAYLARLLNALGRGEA
ncbi:MAG: NAD(P)-dependent oxidoreductase, partial [Anaerolineae bacterium]|nr:NAD(P)-dependent oxidoreductase [Anaerolineae bacterium]